MVLEDTPKPGAAPTDDYMKIAQLRFAASQKVAGAADELKKVITARKMTPLYIAVCEQLGWKSDAALLSSMKADNATALEALDAKIKESEEQEGETEIREAFLARAEHHIAIGEKDVAYAAIEETYKKTVAMGPRLDLVLAKLVLFRGPRDGELCERVFNLALLTTFHHLDDDLSTTRWTGRRV